MISHNFNAVELVGLREMMMNFSWRLLDEYERIWRINNRISDDKPSTLYPGYAAHMTRTEEVGRVA